jgi:hypothetical protein
MSYKQALLHAIAISVPGCQHWKLKLQVCVLCMHSVPHQMGMFKIRENDANSFYGADTLNKLLKALVL